MPRHEKLVQCWHALAILVVQNIRFQPKFLVAVHAGVQCLRFNVSKGILVTPEKDQCAEGSINMQLHEGLLPCLSHACGPKQLHSPCSRVDTS